MAKIEAFAANRLLIYSVSLAASYILMRSAADSLFLARIGNDGLATVFVISSIATAISATSWFLVTQKARIIYVTTFAGVACSCATFAAWLFLPDLRHS